MSTMRAQDRRAVAMGTAIVLVVGAYTLGVRPAMAHLAESHAMLAEQRALLVRERALVADSARLLDVQRTAARALAAESPRLFAGDSVAATANLTSFTTDMATTTGVRLTTVEGRAPRAEHGVIQLAVDLRGEGSWRQVLLFVHALETSSRLVNVASVRIERGARGGPLGGTLVSMAATVVSFAKGTE
ncbi:MAG: Pilus assembly protein PilO [Gemmatimonadetes bacterium]|nr:Pilus assembly protein PilO [Gemmatimonadota bacterium]